MKEPHTQQFSYCRVERIQSAGEGSRVCIDFVDLLEPEEGLLLGNTGHGSLLLLSENHSTQTYPARPFRVNAGGVHHYLQLAANKTCYLGELQPGDFVPVWNARSLTQRSISVGRLKIEKRPLLRLDCRLGERAISVTLQDSDSVSLYARSGDRLDVQSLQTGVELLCRPDRAGRHLGQPIEEYIREF